MRLLLARGGPAYAPWRFPDHDHAGALEFVHAALLAASPHNTQPWRFWTDGARLRLLADFGRSLGAFDPSGRELFVSLGCALESLLVAAPALGLAAALALFPDPSDPSVVAEVSLAPAEPQDGQLHHAIARRRTNRGPYADFPLAPGIIAALDELAAEEPAVRLRLLTGAAEKGAFREGTIAAAERIIGDGEMWAASCGSALVASTQPVRRGVGFGARSSSAPSSCPGRSRCPWASISPRPWVERIGAALDVVGGVKVGIASGDYLHASIGIPLGVRWRFLEARWAPGFTIPLGGSARPVYAGELRRGIAAAPVLVSFQLSADFG
jgi:hypothetical protein